MRRPRKQAPTRGDIDTGSYDAHFLLGPYERLELARSRDGEVRNRSASGGVLTEVCSALLQSGEIDAVLHVGFAPDDPLNPRVVVSRSPEELLSHGGSVYSYISPKEFMKRGPEMVGKRLAVICQPCHVPMFRRYQTQGFQKVDGGEIRYILSFFCGYNMTHDATLYLLDKAGVRPHEVEWIRYRDGEYPGGFAVKAGHGPKAGKVVRFGKEAYEYLNLAFLRGGCSRCSLYMGDGADLSCGDAWLREHRNLTSVLVRTGAGIRALAAAGERLERYELPERTLMHMHLHNLIAKKHGNPLYLRLLTVLFREVLPHWLAPFRLFSWLSLQRRKRKIGVSLPKLARLGERHE